ncbi:MAG: hypothetical protein ABI797_00420 [Chloroflexota bacterium]
MRFLMFAVFAVLMASALVVAPASAHFGGGAFIVVPSDHIDPGSTFEVIGADLAPASTVDFKIVRDESVVSLGTFVSGADGHFTTQLQLPADYPDGYAQLFATATDGTEASTWVLVGARTESTPAPPGATEWWSDPSVLIVGVFLIGGFAAVAYALLKRKSGEPVPARAGQRGPVASKRSRTRGRR